LKGHQFRYETFAKMQMWILNRKKKRNF
jgi:hypothetical protein